MAIESNRIKIVRYRELAFEEIFISSLKRQFRERTNTKKNFEVLRKERIIQVQSFSIPSLYP